jgi:nitrite reductase/ring-hydroxylating ferredoxin subunit
MGAPRGMDREDHDGMSLMIHTMPRSGLPENGVVAFDVAGARYLVADVDGDVQAFSVLGRSERRIDRAVVADGRVLCPLHGWPIDPVDGRCGAGQRCRYQPLSVEVVGEEIRVSLASP